MPRFHYLAKTTPNLYHEGDLEATTSESAAQLLSQRGLVPITISTLEAQEAGASGLLCRLGLRRPRRHLTIREQALFARHLGDLLEAGLTLSSSVKVLTEQSPTAPLRAALAELDKAITSGQSLSGALRVSQAVFPSAFVGAVRAGEASGSLDTALRDAAGLLEQEDDLRRRVREALIYPAFVACVGTLTLVALFTYAIPRLTLLYRDFGQALPLPTRLLIGLSTLARTVGPPVILALTLGLGLGMRRLNQRPAARKALERRLFDLPRLGALLRQRELVRFARVFATLLHGGVPALDALRLAAQTSGNQYFADELRRAADRIHEGWRLGEALRQVSLFPRTFVSMVQVGEEGGHLDESLTKAARFYERELESQLKEFLTVLEPTLIVVLGAIVAFVVVAMMLPILQVDLGVR